MIAEGILGRTLACSSGISPKGTIRGVQRYNRVKFTYLGLRGSGFSASPWVLESDFVRGEFRLLRAEPLRFQPLGRSVRLPSARRWNRISIFLPLSALADASHGPL